MAARGEMCGKICVRLNLPVQKFSERVAGFVFAPGCPFTDDDILYLDLFDAYIWANDD